MAVVIKTFNGLVIGSLKTYNGLAKASAKTILGLDNTGGGGGGSFTVISSVAESLGLNGGTTSAISTTGSDLIIAVIADFQGATATSISDSQSNSWNVLTLSEVSAGPRCRIAYTVAPVTSASHQFVLAGNGSFSALAVMAVSGSNATPFDQQNGNTASGSTTCQPGSVTPAVNNELVIAGEATSSTSACSIDSGYTIQAQAAGVGGSSFGVALAYLQQGTAGAINPTFTFPGSTDIAARAASFKPA